MRSGVSATARLMADNRDEKVTDSLSSRGIGAVSE